MQKPTALLTLLVASLTVLSGCPGENPLVGRWILTIGKSTERGLELMPNGEAVPFAVDVQLLAGTFTWEVEGDRVVFHQVAGGNRNIWAAELLSETSMSGAWVGWAGATHGVSTTFTAEKE